MLVALEGIDGSGKTTVCRLICEELHNVGIQARFLKKSFPDTDSTYVTQQLSKLREVIWPEDNGAEHHLLGDDYWLFLMAAWFSAIQENRLGFENETNVITLYDGWYYRFLAKFINKGYDEQWLFSLFSNIQDPDITILLDVDPSIAWRRRANFKEPEIGRSDGHTGEASSAYCHYQNAIRSRLQELANRRSWYVVEQVEATTPNEIVSELVPVLLARFRNNRAIAAHK